MNKLSFSAFNKLGSTVVSGTIKENKENFDRVIDDIKKKQAEISKLKDVDNQQLNIVIKL
ncbi:hypothetical protein AAFN85_18390 [Mucilaginibacter sp. CAU 1740]|uniref:hypothetical protein n=1 Tax=Mucilaginibacter sp. CAU 1740 TaxID=3140365 RepID=UPI00325C057A